MLGTLLIIGAGVAIVARARSSSGSGSTSDGTGPTPTERLTKNPLTHIRIPDEERGDPVYIDSPPPPPGATDEAQIYGDFWSGGAPTPGQLQNAPISYVEDRPAYIDLKTTADREPVLDRWYGGIA